MILRAWLSYGIVMYDPNIEINFDWKIG